MARILIRPEDLARLARRFDAAADELTRSARRITRSLAEVGLNRADESFPAAHVAERSRLVDSNLRRLATEFRVDGALSARTVDDAEFDDDGRWTAGLTSSSASGSGAVGSSISPWSSVAAGLRSLEIRTSPIGADRPAANRPIGAGGLFRTSSVSAVEGGELLDRLTERLEGSPFAAATTVGGSGAGEEAAAGAVWSRIVGELFAAEDDP